MSNQSLHIAFFISLTALVACSKSPDLSGKETATNAGTVVNETRDTVDQLTAAIPFDILPTGDLAEMYSIGNDFTDLQRDIKKQELRGKVVEWELPVYEIKLADGAYRIQSSSEYRSPKRRERVVDAVITLYANSDEDRRYLESLKTGDNIKVRGVVNDITFRVFSINPAILAPKSLEEQVMTQHYGRQQKPSGCWMSDAYCMKILRKDDINTGNTTRIYLLAAGVDPQGARPTAGRLGAFVFNADAGKPHIIAATSKIDLGQFGTPPTEWDLVQVGPANYWGWQSSVELGAHGYESAEHFIFAPYKDEIRNLTPSLASLISDVSAVGDEKGTVYEAKIKFDTTAKAKSIYPLKVTVTKTAGGKKTTGPEKVLDFDRVEWHYVMPGELTAPPPLEGNVLKTN